MRELSKGELDRGIRGCFTILNGSRARRGFSFSYQDDFVCHCHFNLYSSDIRIAPHSIAPIDFGTEASRDGGAYADLEGQINKVVPLVVSD